MVLLREVGTVLVNATPEAVAEALARSRAGAFTTRAGSRVEVRLAGPGAVEGTYVLEAVPGGTRVVHGAALRAPGLLAPFTLRRQLEDLQATVSRDLATLKRAVEAPVPEA